MPRLSRPADLSRPAVLSGHGTWYLFLGLLTYLGGCGDGCGCSEATTTEARIEGTATTAAAADASAPKLDAAAQKEAERQARLDAEFPLHGLITGTQLRVQTEPDPEATVRGWVRMGSRVRLGHEAQKTPTCRSGWRRVFPDGWVCTGQGVEVGDTPPTSELAINPPPKDAALPYSYYFVKEYDVPEYHRLPSRNEQRGAAKYIERYRELLEKNEKLAARMEAGELPKEPRAPAVVRTFLKRGFFVAGAGVEERARRRFVRTVRGSYVKEAQLQPRSGSDFQGVELNDEQSLPVAWTVRAARPFEVRTRDDGTHAFIADEEADPLPRYTVVDWEGHERVGNHVLHKLSDGRYLKHWFLAVADRIDPPSEIGPDEPWVHVGLDQQTLVLYRGKTPVFATLVSSGLEEHETPEGIFTIRTKRLADTMADLGPEAGDDSYRVEDVPWTQYFAGSLALHGAFWHDRFGLPRSHGCINLAPQDARRVFDHTWPELEPGWHGLSTDGTGLPGSKVVITR